MLTTATDLLFTGGREGYFMALDARNGNILWKASLGGQIVMGPVTYQVEGKQRRLGHRRPHARDLRVARLTSRNARAASALKRDPRSPIGTLDVPR